ncbi:MAG TPA: polysaccharide deacetylase family protein [Clostridia bacterium]|nr:polysaccharide deacetylase family protein [Clostridia bacterium]
MDNKYLIINADDFGMCRAANLATFDLFEKGGISSSTVMMPCGWAKEACVWAGKHPEHAVGVHLTFTSEWGKYRWAPVNQKNTSSLRDEEGYFYHENDGFEDNCDIDEVEGEIRAQISLAKKLGLNPSHIDNHMGSLYGMSGNYEVMPRTLEICGELGYAFRMFTKLREENIPSEFPDNLSIDLIKMFIDGYAKCAKENNVILIDHLLFPEWTNELKTDYNKYREYMLNRLSNIPEGEITETFIHPSLECDEIKGITALWHCRVWEHKLFADPSTRQHLESKGVKYINYRDVIRMKSC